MTPRLKLSGLAKTFGENRAVRSMDMELASGEFLSLLGPSGCGKSTTLAMIAGFETPTTGDIHVDGVRINDLPPGRRAIGLVFQDYAVFSRLKVRANLAFGLEAQKVSRGERNRRIEAIARTLDLEPIMDRRGGELNMSEMQRVALARVLVTEPKLLLLDEPMSNLDAALRASLRSELKLLQKQLGQTVLYVTHDQVEALAMSDRIAVMHNGVVEQIGTPDKIYHRPRTRFVAEFIGDPPINVIECDVRTDGGGASAWTALHGPIPLGRRAISPGSHHVAVRPHDIAFSVDGTAGGVETVVRLVENHGVEHIAYCEYGESLVSVSVPAGAAEVGNTCFLGLDAERIHVIRRDDQSVVERGVAA